MIRLRSLLLLVSLAACCQCFADAGPDQYYELSTVKPPENSALEVGGMAFASDNSLMISTRRGEIWSFKGGRWNRFASGLQEPLLQAIMPRIGVDKQTGIQLANKS